MFDFLLLFFCRKIELITSFEDKSDSSSSDDDKKVRNGEK